MAQVRPYRGVDAPQRIAGRRRRLLEAGLDLLGGETVPADLTVRAICSQSGLAARYFYESFADKDEFVGAVFDWVVADIAATTQAAVAAAPPREQSRAGMANIVRTISDDARVGRLLFSARPGQPGGGAQARGVRRRCSRCCRGQHAGVALQLEHNDRIKAAAHFVVGGVGADASAPGWPATSAQPRPLATNCASTSWHRDHSTDARPSPRSCTAR